MNQLDNNSSSFKKLQKQWYEIIATTPNSDGEVFQEIEDTSSKEEFLIEWHSFKYVAARTCIRRQDTFDYQRRVESLSKHPRFIEICESLTSWKREGWQASVTLEEVQIIWDFHMAGWPERRIAQHISRSKTCVHGVIMRMKAWAEIL